MFVRRSVLFAAFSVMLGLSSCAPDDSEILDTTGDTRDDDARAADNVEIKVTVRADQIARATARLRLDPDVATRRDVYFYDTPSLRLYQAGLVLRARREDNGPDDSTVKLRPMNRTDVASSWFRVDGFKCETDVVGSRSVDSCSLSVEQNRGEIGDVARGARGIDRLFSAEQEQLIEQYARTTFRWSELRVLGAVQAHVWRVVPAALRTRVTAERWTLPDGRALLELSVRVPRTQFAAMQRRFNAWIESLGLDASDQQDTKTRVALEYFSSRAR